MSGVVSFYAVYSVAIGNGLIYGLAALGVYVSLRAGLFNLSETGFMAISAYTVAVLTVKYHEPFVLAVVVGCAVCCVVGGLMATALVRLRGHFLGIATLGFSGLVEGLAIYFSGITGGEIGFNGIPTYTSNIVVVVIVGLAVFGVMRVETTKLGRAWMADSRDPIASGSLGLRTRRVRVEAFMVTTVFCALAGALYAGNNISIVPESFGFPLLTSLLTYTIVGGLGTSIGPVLGAVVLSSLPEWASGLQLYATYVDGALLVLAILFLPLGIGGAVVSAVSVLRNAANGRRAGRLWQRRRWQSHGGALIARQGPGEGAAAAQAGGVIVLGEAGAISSAALLDCYADGEGMRSAVTRDPALRDHWTEQTEDEPRVAIQAFSLRKSFGGVQALVDVSVDVVSGGVTGVIGPNGSGKTTLVNCLSGIIGVDGGKITIAGKDASQWNASRTAREGRVRRTFQNVRLLSHLSVVENVMLGLDDRNDYLAIEGVVYTPRFVRGERWRRERAIAILESLGLGAIGSRAPGELPYGVQRRVELARALIGQPAVLLVDEPTAGMTAAETAQFGANIRTIAKVLGTAILVIEHKMRFIADTCDRVVVLHLGHVVSTGSVEEVMKDPVVAEVYLGGSAGASVERHGTERE
ncbi:MAG: branched-chain amino acid ABC transporter ATP-binding protein/permease [Candidatus Dormibacteria bacterium]